MVVVRVAGPLFLSTFVNRLLTQRIKFKLMKNFERLLFLLIFQIVAVVKPSQINLFFLVTCWRSCWIGYICYRLQGVHVGDPMLHTVHAESWVLSDRAFATQIARNTHILYFLGYVLPEDVFIRGSSRSALYIHRSVRFEPDCLALIFELRVENLKCRVCVVSWSLQASISQKGEHLELLTNNELSVVEVENVVMR